MTQTVKAPPHHKTYFVTPIKHMDIEKPICFHELLNWDNVSREGIKITNNVR